jgi:transposase
MDLDTGAVIAADLHPADQGDRPTMASTLASAVEHLASVGAAPADLRGALGIDRRQRLSRA